MVLDPFPEELRDFNAERAQSVVRTNVLGIFGLTTLALILGALGAVRPAVSTALLLFLGAGIYVEVAKRLRKSLGIENFVRLKGFAGLFIIPLIVFLGKQILFGPQTFSFESLLFLLEAYIVAFAIFLVAAFLFLGLNSKEPFQEFRFHWQLVIVAGVMVLIPTALIIGVKFSLETVIPQVSKMFSGSNATG